MNIYPVDLNTKVSWSLLQWWKAQFIQGSDRCHAGRFEGSTESNQMAIQPQRHKDGGRC